jgi:hypothetical protein
MTDTNAVFSTSTTGMDLSTLPKGAWYVELEDYDRPRLAKGYWVSPERIGQYAIEATGYVGGLDEPTAALMQSYAGRWTRPGQIEFLEKVNGGPLSPELVSVLASVDPAVRSILDQAEAGSPQAQDLVRYAEGLAASRNGGEDPADDVYEAVGDYDDSDVLKRIQAWADRKESASDLAMLEMLYEQPAIADEERATGAAEPLPPETLELLGVLHASGVLYSGEEWIPSADVRAMAAKQLGWPDNPEGDRQIAAALRELTPPVESKRKGKDRTTVYSVAELRTAAERHRDAGK